MDLKQVLRTDLFEILERNGISTAKQIILLSVWDIKKYTNLSFNDISEVKNIVSQHLSPPCITLNTLKTEYSEKLNARLSTGCDIINQMLKGGFRRGALTEIFGESGCGKTQLALQTIINNSTHGSVFICTEDPFPIKRFEEIKRNCLDLHPINIGENVFVEHITEATDLTSCIRVRLPKLLAQNKVSLLVIDSIAAPLRCENTNYVKRAEELREIGFLLTSIAQEHNVAIICINQVTGSFDNSVDLLPSLGLAWSNMVSTRLMIRKTTRLADLRHSKTIHPNTYLRELLVVFSPDLLNDKADVVITSNGIHGIRDY